MNKDFSFDIKPSQAVLDKINLFIEADSFIMSSLIEETNSMYIDLVNSGEHDIKDFLYGKWIYGFVKKLVASSQEYSFIAAGGYSQYIDSFRNIMYKLRTSCKWKTLGGQTVNRLIDYVNSINYLVDNKATMRGGLVVLNKYRVSFKIPKEFIMNISNPLVESVKLTVGEDGETVHVDIKFKSRVAMQPTDEIKVEHNELSEEELERKAIQAVEGICEQTEQKPTTVLEIMFGNEEQESDAQVVVVCKAENNEMPLEGSNLTVEKNCTERATTYATTTEKPARTNPQPINDGFNEDDATYKNLEVKAKQLRMNDAMLEVDRFFDRKTNSLNFLRTSDIEILNSLAGSRKSGKRPSDKEIKDMITPSIRYRWPEERAHYIEKALNF